MRLILAVSADGFLAKGPDDDMSWTGKTDKAVFRLLTGVGGVCAAGSTTYDALPPLPARQVHRLSRQDVHRGFDDALAWFAHTFPSGWLLGGPTVAQDALERGFVDQVYLCRSQTRLFRPTEMVGFGAMIDTVTPWLMSRGERQNAGVPWSRAQRILLGDVTVDVWRCQCPTATARPASGAG